MSKAPEKSNIKKIKVISQKLFPVSIQTQLLG